jgi:peptidoglycan/LPS O-acetylase OafA/YrhL
VTITDGSGGGEPNYNGFPILNQITRYGYLGVEVFFMISGFVILMTAWGHSLERFVSSRIARLYPAYWVVVLFTIVLRNIWGDGQRKLSALAYLSNFTMFQEALGEPDVQGPFWSLLPELKFYLLMGIFIQIGITWKRVVAFSTLWPITGLLFMGFSPDFANSMLVARYAPYFSLGMCLYMIYWFSSVKEKSPISNTDYPQSPLIFWLVAAFNLVLSLHLSLPYSNEVTGWIGTQVSQLVVAFVLVSCVVIIWLVTSTKLRDLLSYRWFTVLGFLTYPLYLVHSEFGAAFIFHFHERLGKYPTLVIAFCLVLLLAILIHYQVEERFHDRFRSALGRGLGQVSKKVTNG